VNSIALSFVVLNALALLVLPRRWAPVPLLAGACYITLSQGINAGPFSFTVIRILAAVGFIRIIIRGERLPGGINRVDCLMLLWAIWLCASGALHTADVGLVFRLGMVYNACGFYFLLRVFCCSIQDVTRVCRAVAFLLAPVAVEMVYEHVAFHNLFSMFGGVSEVPQVRAGNIRASGPFAHPILAGTVGAVSLPLSIGIWRYHKMAACIGTVVCITIVLTSRSSGPFMSAVFSIGALLLWGQRNRMQLFRWAFVLLYIVLDLSMKVPAYYLIGRIDISGGSTGWHRARLIESSLEHLDEWWLAGTDYTRHWMPTGVTWHPNHTDITNHYLQMGVLGGLPLMFLFILILAAAFSFVGKTVRPASMASQSEKFLMWAAGSALFAHVATCISVSYFDQSVVFVYLTLGVIASAWASQAAVVTAASKTSGAPHRVMPAASLSNGAATPYRQPATTMPLVPRPRRNDLPRALGTPEHAPRKATRELAVTELHA
jgi:hypothetical protein